MAQRRARRALRKLRAFVTTRCAGGGRECDSVEGAGVDDRPAGRVDIPQHVVSVRHGVDRKEAPGRSADAEARLSWVRHAGVPVVPLDGLLVGSAPRRRLRSAERQPRLPLCLLERRGDTRLDCLVERVRVARADHDCADRLPALGRRPAQMRRAGAPADPEREPDRRQRDDCCDCRDRSPARATPRHRPIIPRYGAKLATVTGRVLSGRGRGLTPNMAKRDVLVLPQTVAGVGRKRNDFRTELASPSAQSCPEPEKRPTPWPRRTCSFWPRQGSDPRHGRSGRGNPPPRASRRATDRAPPGRNR